MYLHRKELSLCPLEVLDATNNAIKTALLRDIDIFGNERRAGIAITHENGQLFAGKWCSPSSRVSCLSRGGIAAVTSRGRDSSLP
jgi:hypothetical protein